MVIFMVIIFQLFSSTPLSNQLHATSLFFIPDVKTILFTQRENKQACGKQLTHPLPVFFLSLFLNFWPNKKKKKKKKKKQRDQSIYRANSCYCHDRSMMLASLASICSICLLKWDGLPLKSRNEFYLHLSLGRRYLLTNKSTHLPWGGK